MNSSNIIIYTGYVILAINTFLYLFNYQFRSKPVKIFTLYLIGSLILQLYSSYLFNNKDNNLFISHYFFIGKFILLSLFFKHILEQKIIKKTITISLVIILIALAINVFFFSYQYQSFNLFEILITTIPLVAYCFLFFIQKMTGSDSKFIYVTSGMFLYFLCSLLLYVAGNLNADTRNIIWHSNAVLYIVYQVLIFVEWYKNFRKPNNTAIQ